MMPARRPTASLAAPAMLICMCNVEWWNSGLRRALVEHGRWLDLYMLFCNQYAQAAMDMVIPNMPFNIANEKALADGSWMGLWRIAIQLFTGSELDEWNVMETL